MSDGLKLAFGQDQSGRLVSIHNVERGAACNCVCPGCGRPLVARKGDELRHHFAHAVDAECSGAVESMLHKLGKQIIVDAKRVWLPEVVASFGGGTKRLHVRKLFVAERVEVEPTFGPVRPDLILHAGGRRVAVEILVTHLCPPEKLTYLREQNLATIEIDMRRMRMDELTADEVETSVLEMNPRHWLHNALVRAEEDRMWQEWERQDRAMKEKVKARQEEAQRIAASHQAAQDHRLRAQRYAEAMDAAKRDVAWRDRPLGLDIPWKRDIYGRALEVLGGDAALDWYSSPTFTSDLSARDFSTQPTSGEIAAFHYEMDFAATLQRQAARATT